MSCINSLNYIASMGWVLRHLQCVVSPPGKVSLSNNIYLDDASKSATGLGVSYSSSSKSAEKTPKNNLSLQAWMNSEAVFDWFGWTELKKCRDDVFEDILSVVVSCLIVVHKEVVSTGFLLRVFNRRVLVDSWPVVIGVSSECDLQLFQELVHAW